MSSHQLPLPPPRRPLSHYPVATVTGMLLFISAIAAYPRISITRSPDFTTITYRHISSPKSSQAPLDQGTIIASDPLPKHPASSSPSSSPSSLGHSTSEKGDLSKEWIFDTGATTHVCCNSTLMHGTTYLAHSSLAHTMVGHFGPHPVPVRGVGDVTFDLPGASSSSSSPPSTPSKFLVVVNGRQDRPSRMTLRNVSYIPDGGVNLISWSQMKRARGMRLGLREGSDGSLEVWDVGRGEGVMRFVLRRGLYFLEQENGKEAGER